MKRGFIRAMYGDCTTLANNIRKDIDRAISVDNNPDYVTYVFGEENFKFAKEINVNPVLLDKNPFIKDVAQYRFWHKLYIYNYAMNVDGYDEIVFIDWDCIPTRKLPNDFWEVLGKKEKIQGCSYSLVQQMCKWRGHRSQKWVNGSNTSINSGFLYMRDKAVPPVLLNIWEENKCLNQVNDEAPISYYIDQMMGGWVGLEKWWDLFEPEWCNLEKKASFPRERLNTKNICFVHKWV